LKKGRTPKKKKKNGATFAEKKQKGEVLEEEPKKICSEHDKVGRKRKNVMPHKKSARAKDKKNLKRKKSLVNSGQSHHLYSLTLRHKN